MTIFATMLLAAGWATGNAALVAKGREIYAQACVHCHGPDGRGNQDWESAVRPLDFTACANTGETSEHWETIVARGGTARGLASVMPGFGEAYTPEEIKAVVAYVRTWCPQADAYPPGDLNFRRLLTTGKAFPESELVLRLSHRPGSLDGETELEAACENRLGKRFQYELELPLRLAAPQGEGSGLADLNLEGKYVLHFDLERREILSGGASLTLPTGSTGKGLGAGTSVVRPFLGYAKAWGANIVQGSLDAGVPFDADRADPDLNLALGYSRLFGPERLAWAPAVELVLHSRFESGPPDYAVWLEVSKPLNKLGHVIASLGARRPIRPRDEGWSLEAYVLWDFADGPFWIGW